MNPANKAKAARKINGPKPLPDVESVAETWAIAGEINIPDS